MDARADDRPLAGTTAVVVHGGTPVGADLARGLAAQGAAVGVVGQADLASPATLGEAFAAAAAELGPVDLVVLPVVPGTAGDAPPAAELADLDDAGWRAACEEPLRAVRLAMVAAHRALAGRGGRLVLVGPTAGITGEAGRVGYASVAEGARVMAKSCSRSWGADGITLHWVSVPTEAFTGLAPSGPRLSIWDPSLPAPTVAGDVAAVVGALASPALAALTGTSLAVDGGVLLHG